MEMEDQEMKSRRMKRHSDNKRKMNRILNVLIAIVSALIVINVYFIVKDDGDHEVAEDTKSVQEKNDHGEHKENPSEEKDTNDFIDDNEQNNHEEGDVESGADEDEIIVSASTDANVEKVIVNNNWKVTPTRQTGEHVSAFEEGHVDYEEKLITIRNAVELPEDDIIYWSVRNDGTGKGAVAVVSSKDLTEKFRVHIKWIDNSGWIPIKVEVLKQIPKN
ncbi:YrrS family protein [Ureibacillus suwonensis]|uniref:YrrS family protein n=1 Tax=Ureibacillus suwonensis TaxID=313007 RepID=A0ABW0RCB6_9BACL